MPPGDKPSDPKGIVAGDKLPLHMWPATATAAGTVALLNGALKYGRTNWRAVGVQASTYVDAAKRHIEAWFEGEELDPDDGVPHLSAALASLAIIVDARAAGLLNDDRMIAGGYRDFMTEMTSHVARLKKLHAHRTPRHYTISDSQSRRVQRAAGAPDAVPEQTALKEIQAAGKTAPDNHRPVRWADLDPEPAR